MQRKFFILALFLSLNFSYAHEFWVEPSQYYPSINTRIDVRLWIGNNFEGTVYTRNPFHIQDFVLARDGNIQEIDGVAGLDPAGWLDIASDGIMIIAYNSKPTLSQLDAEKFEQYLQSEGLEKIIQMRKEKKESKEAGREMYHRCAKAIIATKGTTATKGYEQVLGLPLEIVAETNPISTKVGEEFSVQVLFNNEPISGILLTAIHKKNREQTHSIRTDNQGRGHFTLNFSGEWIIRTIHMQRINSPSTEWQSWWASLTFQIP